MEILKNIFYQFLDKELLAIIGGIIIFLILLRVLSNFLFRHKILKISVIGIILILIILGVFWIVDNRKDLYSNSSSKYVIGEVKNISSVARKIEVKVISSNLKNKNGYLLNDEIVIVNIDINCKFLDKRGNEITFNDIAFYDTVQVYVKENIVEDTKKDNLSGIKVILKNDYSK